MNYEFNSAIAQAKNEVQMGNHQIESALSGIKEKVDRKVQDFGQIQHRYQKAAKNPLVLFGAVLLIGILCGETIKYSYSKRKPTELIL